MAQQTGEVCGNCHQLAQTYRYQVMVLERTKVRTVAMQTCGVCAHNLIDVLESMSGKPAEVFDASEGIRSA